MISFSGHSTTLQDRVRYRVQDRVLAGRVIDEMEDTTLRMRSAVVELEFVS